MPEIWIKMEVDEWAAIRHCAFSDPPGEPTQAQRATSLNVMIQYFMLALGDASPPENPDDPVPILIPMHNQV